MKGYKKILLIALMAAIGARLYVSFFVEGFIVTFTAIILALALYFDDELHPVVLGCTVAVVSPGLRYLVEFLFHGQAVELMGKVYPDIFFYLTYGLIFYMTRKLLGDHYKRRFYIVAFASDFMGNLMELVVRTRLMDMEWSMVQGIFLVAVGRTLIIILFVYLAINYTNLLVKQEHEKRYQYLMHLSSRFRSEIYFLHKNMNQIERLVSVSHQLRQQVEGDLSELTLELSKGMHEVKKDYIRVVQGLEEIYDGKLNLEELSLKDLFKLIESNTMDFIRQKNKQIDLNFKCKVDAPVRFHFYFMTVIRNLVNNSIEACDSQGSVNVMAYEVDDYVEIIVSDNGRGIDAEDGDFIFNTGYSTKFDEITGDIYRGLGLTLVKDLVENVFKGSIEFESDKAGTKFLVRMKKTVLAKGEDHEILHIG